MFKQFKKSESTCVLCFNTIDTTFFLDRLMNFDEMCKSCRKEVCMKPKIINVKGIKILGLYPYNEFIRSLILRYKEGYDEYIAKILMVRLRYTRVFFKEKFIVIPIPSTIEKTKVRGFKSSEVLAQYLGLKIVDCIMNTSLVPQKEKNRKDREDIDQFLSLKDIDLIQNKSIIIFDDVLTTGATIKAVYELLKPYVKEVYCIVCTYSTKKVTVYT